MGFGIDEYSVCCPVCLPSGTPDGRLKPSSHVRYSGRANVNTEA
jgi:hypothetical protein